MSCGDGNFDPDPVGVVVQDEGVTVVAEATTLNFVGDGVIVTDAGGGVAQISIVETAQIFAVTLAGTETDVFTVALPAARADALYLVQATMAGPQANAMKLIKILDSTRTINGFDVQLSAVAELNDIIHFVVQDPT
jgi:hypothetical protein